VEAIILAGGFGTRLQKVVSDVPKSMAMVNDKPFLEYLLNYLTGQGIDRVILSVGYKQDVIRNRFKDHYKHIAIEYAVEESPLGTGGGILNAMHWIKGESVFAMNGDSMFRFDFVAMMNHHLKNRADLTMALRFLDDTSRFGTVKIDEGNQVTGFFEKDKLCNPGYINGGVYIIDKAFYTSLELGTAFSIEKDCFEKQYQKARIFGFPAKGYFLDIGIPDDYMIAQDDFKRFDD
jgi:D-glycero-alpha-D-manno-heptose 1-phosphate guanylyltransferase